MNYAQLSTLIQDYTENYETSFITNIPEFVKLAEKRVYNAVYFPAIRRNQTATLTPSNQYLTLPSDWLATFSLAVIDPSTEAHTFLIDKDVNFIRECYPDPGDTGVPAYYAVFDKNTFILGPTPASNYQVEMHYYFAPETIVTASTTWLGDHFPDILLYGSLREAYLYMKGEPDLVQHYERMYQEGMTMLLVLGEGKNRRDAYRSGQERLPVMK